MTFYFKLIERVIRLIDSKICKQYHWLRVLWKTSLDYVSISDSKIGHLSVVRTKTHDLFYSYCKSKIFVRLCPESIDKKSTSLKRNS